MELCFNLFRGKWSGVLLFTVTTGGFCHQGTENQTATGSHASQTVGTMNTTCALPCCKKSGYSRCAVVVNLYAAISRMKKGGNPNFAFFYLDMMFFSKPF